MASFDTTNVAADVQAPNPLKSFGDIANTVNALNQNRMFQAKQLAGQYLTQSVGPDGLPDPAKLNSFLQNDKRTAPFAAEISQNVADLRKTDIGNQQLQATLAQTRYNNLQQIAATAGHSSSNPDPVQQKAENRKAFTTLAAQAAANGQITKEMAQPYLQDLSDGGATDQLINTATVGGAGGAGAFKAAYGDNQQVSLGGHQVGINVNPVTHVQTQNVGNAADLSQTQSPEFRAGRQPFVNPTSGISGTAPQSALSTPTGEPISTPGLTGPHGELQTSLAPGEAEAIGLPKVGSAQQFLDLNKASDGSVARQALLKEMLAYNGDFKSGPGAAKWSGFMTEANRVLGTNFSAKDTPSQQVFGKLAEQFAAQQRSALGSQPTDLQTELARLSNPNGEYSPEAIRQVAGLALGNEEILQKKNEAAQAFQRHGGKPSQYNQFQTQFNSLFDPRYFQESHMTPQQHQTLLKSMTPAQQQAYLAAKAKALSLDFGK